MMIIETVDAETYAENADVFVRKDSGQELYEAYIRVGTTGNGKALIIRQRSGTELTAVRALLKKLQSFMYLMEGAANDRFLAVVNAEAAEQMAQLKALMGEPDDDEDPNDPKNQPS